MNVPIAALTLFHLYHLLRDKRYLSKGSWILVLLGCLLPLVDYGVFLFSDAPGLFGVPLYFHSVFYLAPFLGVLSLWVWIGTRSARRAAQTFLPLLGLLLYGFLTLLSTERTPFLRPLTEASSSLDLINRGYLFPMVLILVLWGTKRWHALKTRTLSLSGLGILVGFLVFNGGLRLVMVGTLPEQMQDPDTFTCEPANILQTQWHVTSLKRDRYIFSSFTVFSGWDETPQVLLTSNDFELAQTLLLDPYFKAIYVHGFKNPLIETKYLSDAMRIKITELLPLRELYWNKVVTLTTGGSGQILEIEREKGYLF